MFPKLFYLSNRYDLPISERKLAKFEQMCTQKGRRKRRGGRGRRRRKRRERERRDSASLLDAMIIYLRKKYTKTF